MSKQQLRQQMKAFRGALTPEEISLASVEITARILDIPEIDRDPILVYVAFRREILTRPLIAALLDRGRVVAVPNLTGGAISARRLRSLDELVHGDFGIQTSMGEAVQPGCSITPGLAFSAAGGRLGFGAGHYDRFFDGRSMFCIGVCLEGQVLEVPMEHHDRYMDAVVTPHRVIRP